MRRTILGAERAYVLKEQNHAILNVTNILQKSLDQNHMQ